MSVSFMNLQYALRAQVSNFVNLHSAHYAMAVLMYVIAWCLFICLIQCIKWYKFYNPIGKHNESTVCWHAQLLW